MAMSDRFSVALRGCRWSVLIAIALLAACASSPRSPETVLEESPARVADTAPEHEAVVEETSRAVTQLLLRGGRSSTGKLLAHAPARMADEAIRWTWDTQYAFDGWEAMITQEKVTSVVAWPSAGPLANAVFSRLEQVAPEGTRIEWLDEPAKPDLPAIWVISPRWRDGTLVHDPQALVEAAIASGGAPPALVLIDLLEPQIDGVPWLADEIIVSSAPELAALVTRYELEARASGSIPDATALAESMGLVLDSIDWSREAVVP